MPVRLMATLAVPELKPICDYYHAFHSGVFSQTDLEAYGITPENWRRMYRKPKTVYDILFRVLTGQSLSELQQNLEKATAMVAAESPAVLQKAIQEQGYEGVLQIAPEIDDLLYDQNQRSKQWLEHPDPAMMKGNEVVGLFKTLVVVPCMVLYSEPIWTLYRRAYAGNPNQQIDALDKLLRLDKSILSDPWIHRSWFRWTTSGNSPIASRLSAALSSKPPKMPPKRLKVYAAALVWLTADICKHRLTAPAIRELFDAISREYDGNLIDMDLADSDEALQKAIKRTKDRLCATFLAVPSHSSSS